MKRPDYSILLKMLAIAAVTAVIYVVAVMIRAAVFGMDGGFASVAYFVITLFFGYFTGRALLSRAPVFAIKASTLKPVKFLSFMLNLRDAACSISAFAAWALILLPVLSTLLIFHQLGIFRTVFEAIVAIIGYAAVLKYSQPAFSQIMKDFTAYTGFFTMAVCLEMLNFFDKIAYLKPWLLAISYFFILVYLLVRNQEDIDSNIFDKKHIEKSILPGNLRRLNSFWVCMLFLAIVLLFNLKPLVMLLLRLLIKISIYVAAAFMWLIGHFFQSSDGTQQSGSPGTFGFFGTGAEIIRPFGNLISSVFRNAILLYVIYRFLRLFIKRVPGLALKLLNLVRKLFAIKKGGNAPETMDYSDETETVKPVHEDNPVRHLKKKMNRSRRTLKSISDPVEKIRYMYASIMAMLPMLGIRTELSDTTADILKKTTASVDISNELSPLTVIYNQVRYGGKVPDSEAMAKAEGHFDKVVEVIGQK